MNARYFIVFLIIWCVGCAIADYVFEIDANAWRMMWGYIVGTVGEIIGNKIKANA